MKGTAILIKEDQKIKFLEDVDHSVYKKIKEQEGSKHCTINDKKVKFNHVHSVVWCDDHIDWDYGY